MIDNIRRSLGSVACSSSREHDNLHMASLHCAVCRKYTGSLRSLRSFSAVWISGSTNQKVSNIVDHATSDVRKVAMERKRAESVKASGGSVALSSAIGRGAYLRWTGQHGQGWGGSLMFVLSWQRKAYRSLSSQPCCNSNSAMRWT